VSLVLNVLAKKFVNMLYILSSLESSESVLLVFSPVFCSSKLFELKCTERVPFFKVRKIY
jgi:hypothetical protein